uniref:Anthranilate N-benzoyltransferase protein 1 n=1 Tax=Aegilops tauschii TaxID=37682 RepID=R7WFI8_AEGTA
MASFVNQGHDLNIRVMSRRLVSASDSSIKEHVLGVSNIDLLHGAFPVSLVCIYPRPPAGGFHFHAVVAAFESGLPSLLNHYFVHAGRIVANPRTGLPEILCNNQGAELIVGVADVALAGLDFSSRDLSVRKIPLPYGGDVPLSVQLVSFACGGFSVAWGHNHLLGDGHALLGLVCADPKKRKLGPKTVDCVNLGYAMNSVGYRFLVVKFEVPDIKVGTIMKSEDATFYGDIFPMKDVQSISRQDMASHDGDGRRATRVQAVSAYMWKTLAAVVGAADTHCRMGWWVDGRRRLTAPEHRALATTSYVGNASIFVLGEDGVEEIQRKPLPEVASMVRELIDAPGYGDRFQEVVDWVEQHKSGATYMDASNIGLGCPTVAVTAMTSFPMDTDLGFGHAAMAMTTTRGRGLCSGFVQMAATPRGDGAWIVSASVWPKLAAALESDELRIFVPITAKHLGLKLNEAIVKENGSPRSRF